MDLPGFDPVQGAAKPSIITTTNKFLKEAIDHQVNKILITPDLRLTLFFSDGKVETKQGFISSDKEQCRWYSILARLKVLANLDPTITDLQQAGSFEMGDPGMPPEYYIDVTTTPSQEGEGLRILIA